MLTRLEQIADLESDLAILDGKAKQEECTAIILVQVTHAKAKIHHAIEELRGAMEDRKEDGPPPDPAEVERQAVELLRSRGWRVEK